MDQKIWRLFKVSAFVGLLLGIPFFIWGIFAAQDAPKVRLAKEYIEANAEIMENVGKIEGYGFGVTDNVEAGREKSRMEIWVEGSRRDVKVVLFFQKDVSGDWIVERHAFR